MKFLVLDPVDQVLSAEERLKQDQKHEREITQLQREYRLHASGKNAPKTNRVLATNLHKLLDQLQQEKKELKACQNVADASAHKREFEKQIESITVHIRCQELIQKQINACKVEIIDLKSQIDCTNKQIVDLNSTHSSDYVYLERVKKARKKIQTFDNRLMVARQKDNKMIAANKHLRDLIANMMVDRAIFHNSWKKMIQKLSYDKKFLIDMIERALVAYHQNEELYFKLDALKAHADKDKHTHITDMLEMKRKLQANEKNSHFFYVKGKTRELAGLEGKELRQRQQFKNEHQSKIEVYQQIIDKCETFYSAKNTFEVVESFQKHEDKYFAHFNYMNELNKQVEDLNQSVDKYHRHIDALRDYNTRTKNTRLETYQNLSVELAQDKLKTEKLNTKLSNNEKELETYLSVVDTIFDMLRCDKNELEQLLGDQSMVNKFNVKHFLAILENKLNEVLSYVYYTQRQQQVPNAKLEVTGIGSVLTDPIQIEDIVLVQQCAECAEGDDVNRHDEDIVWPMSRDTIKEKLKEQVKAPEMQYRLHNISKCRLPRSRIIANRRY